MLGNAQLLFNVDKSLIYKLLTKLLIMKHIAKYKISRLPKESCVDISKNETFHPLSYYLSGGIDLSGDALDNSADVEFDNDDDLKELESEGAMSVPYGDPKMSKFRLVEQYGAYEAQKKSVKSANLDAKTSESGESGE